jgi:hypothetical protein
MKKLIETKKEVVMQEAESKVVDTDGGLLTLLGKTVLFHCMNYGYIGRLMGVNTLDIELHDMQVVFETGAYTSSKMKDAQKIHGSGVGFLKLAAIEAYWEIKQ